MCASTPIPPHPDFPLTLSERGEFADVVIDSGVHTVLSGDGAFLPVEYLRSKIVPSDIAMAQGVAADIGKGDSAMVQMVPTEQFLRRYTFATGVGFAFNVVQVIREQGSAAVQIDGDNVTGWEPAGDFEVATVAIDEGAHDIASADPFGIIQLGWTNSDLGNDPGCIRNEEFTDDDGEVFEAKECNGSYAYPGGMKTEQIFVP